MKKISYFPQEHHNMNSTKLSKFSSNAISMLNDSHAKSLVPFLKGSQHLGKTFRSSPKMQRTQSCTQEQYFPGKRFSSGVAAETANKMQDYLAAVIQKPSETPSEDGNKGHQGKSSYDLIFKKES